MTKISRSLVAAAGLIIASVSAADSSEAPSNQPLANAQAPIGVPEYFDIAPKGKVLDAVKQVMGASVEEAAQTDNALKMYEHARQVGPEVESIVETFPVRLHSKEKYPVKVVSGFETEIVFFDLNGRPWEVGDVSTGNKQFISAAKSEVIPHSIVVAASDGQFAGRTNIKVRFKGLDTSISFPVTINTRSYNETLKVILPGTSPASEGAGEYAGFVDRRVMDDPVGRAILDNPIAPENSNNCSSRLAIAKTITGQTLPGIQPAIFACDGGLYVRARYLTAPAPQPNGITHGPDGYRVYRFIDSGEFFTFRDRSGQPVFIEAVKPQKLIGARFGDGVKLK